MSEQENERMNEEAERVNRIRDYVPEEEFDLNGAQGIAHREIAPYCDNGK